jgi:thiaminase/transcriptional activator TenA
MLPPLPFQHISFSLLIGRDRVFGTHTLGAVLPCFWIYWEVAKVLIERGSPEPLYRRWIETYGGEEFAEIVRAVLALRDRIGEELAPAEKSSFAEHVVITARHEWMFWDMGYRMERWPI